MNRIYPSRALARTWSRPTVEDVDAIQTARESAFERLEVAHEDARSRQDASVPENTRLAYEFELHCFAKWCDRHSLPVMPAPPKAIVVYLQQLADRGRDLRDVPRPEKGVKEGPLAYGSIMRALGAICRAHNRADQPSPWKLQCIRDCRTALGRQLGVAPEKKIALTPDLLRRVVDQIPTETLRGRRDRAMLLLGWHGARRRSEVAAARLEDFRREATGVVWTIPRSKTDQEGRGLEVPLVRAEEPQYCAIVALKQWTQTSKLRSGPLFRRIDMANRLFDHAVTGHFVSQQVQVYARAAGLDPKLFAGHSLRSGWVTTAAKAGRTAHDIMRVTGHRSANTVEGYIQHANVLEDAPGRGLI
jgi:integrase